MLQHVRPVNKSFCLQTLCEENYQKYCRLVHSAEQPIFDTGLVKVTTLETGPFTRTILLHAANTESSQKPVFKCRVYLDTKSIEVIAIDNNKAEKPQQHAHPRHVLNSKWQLNYFLEKWLTFQLQASSVEQYSQRAVSV